MPCFPRRRKRKGDLYGNRMPRARWPSDYQRRCMRFQNMSYARPVLIRIAKNTAANAMKSEPTAAAIYPGPNLLKTSNGAPPAATARPWAKPLPNAGCLGHARKINAIIGPVPAWSAVTAGKNSIGFVPPMANSTTAATSDATVTLPAPNLSAATLAKPFPMAAANARRTASSGGKIACWPRDQANERAAIARMISQPKKPPSKPTFRTGPVTSFPESEPNPRVQR
jgi:hypothetical protein